jgi:CRP-like cAMP-binding protein/TolA-binding protein
MPIARNYNGGSIVYFQGDVGDEIYILQKGRVALISTALDTGEEIKEEVKLGEFFGVKSSLARFPREETAQVLGKTTLVVFKLPEFEQYAMKNTRLIMKMLRVFSRQLRDIHRQVRDILKAGAVRNPAFELLNVAESFYRNGAIDHAVYAFNKYIEYNPNGKNVRRAQEMLQSAKKGLTFPVHYPPPEMEELFEAPEKRAATYDMGMMSADAALDDPFALNVAPKAAAPRVEKSIRTVFDAAMQAISEMRNEDALKGFDECIAFQTLRNADEQGLFNQAHYERGVALVRLHRYDEASQQFSNYIKKFPTGEFVKETIYQMGIIAEAQGNTERARTLYHKVATMPPPDDVTMQARKRLEALG